MSVCLRFCDYFSTFISVNQRFKHDRTATYNRLKRELLSRETYSRNPINYSEGMADDQKDRYIQYLAEQNQDLRLTNDAMKLVLEDFMVQMKELKDQVSSMQSKQSDLETGYQKSASFANRLNGRQRLFRKNLILPIRSVSVTGVNG